MKLVLLALLFSATVQAQVLRCDTWTSVLYTNMGCVGGVEVDVSPKINSFPPAPYVIPMYEHRGPRGAIINAPEPMTLSPTPRDDYRHRRHPRQHYRPYWGRPW